MAYTAEISRANPTCFIFLIDQSGSMDDELEAGISKATFLADVLNKTLMELVITCRKADGILDYFDVGVLAYGDTSTEPGFGGALKGFHLVNVSTLGKSPLRVETRRKRVPDGTGGLVDTEVKFPVWFEPRASGGTPMCAGLRTVAELVKDWCAAHPGSFPPTVLHITDGEATDGVEGDVEGAARMITSTSTADGNTLLMTLHVSGTGGEPIRFPAGAARLPNAYAQMLFRTSSVLPDGFVTRVIDAGLKAENGCRGYVFNGRMDEVIRFFEIGTRPRLAGPNR
jgi:hypothetical protein